jgi:putative addiction module killer protein
MQYEIEKTDEFDKWIKKLKDAAHLARILVRIDRVRRGNFGDHKMVDDNVSELRFFFGPGYRIYYTVKDVRIVLLLHGGDKSGQKKDIAKASEILARLED